ncbi:MAG: hypothetical protein IJT94_11015 [Oscillibacter sp.]|nr:hypothetical protein [Oscillibacter sp.]
MEVKIRITKELPEALEHRPALGKVYTAEHKMTPEPCPREAYYASVDGGRAVVFPYECEEVDE